MKVKRLFGTLRSRIFAALFVISLVPMAVLGGQGYHCAREAVHELAQKHLLAVANARATAVRNWLEEKNRSIETAAMLIDAARAQEHGVWDTSHLQAFLDSYRSVNASFGAVALLDSDWRTIAQSPSGDLPAHTWENTELRDASEGAEHAVFGMAHRHEGGDVGLHVACPVRSTAGEMLGYLSAYLDLTKGLTPALQNREGLYGTGKSYLVDSDQILLTEPLEDSGVALTKRETVTVHDAHAHHASPQVSTYTDYAGSVVLGAALPLGFDGWQVVTEIDRQEALAWLDVLLVRTSATGLATFLAVVVIAFWLSRLVGKPLRQLMQVAHRIRAGHTDERLEQMDVAEAEEVRGAFNAMLDELREKQTEIVRTAKLAYVGELTSSTVHEMRNPLSSIKMNLQAISRAVATDDRHRELGEIALQQAARLELMFSDLLSFGKPVVLRPREAPFDELVAATLDAIGDAGSHKGVTVLSTNGLNGQTLYIDKEQMCRALTNLVGNAIEASPAGGEVIVRGAPAPNDEDTVVVSVLDSGAGLTEEALQRAFQPFYTTKRGGTGLGLPNVQKIVELHGGIIWAENREGGGAVFHMEIPCKRA